MRVHRVVIGLIVGLILGSAIGSWNSPVAFRIVSIVEPLGQLWLNAVRMTVLPLVVSMLFVGVAGRDETADMARVGVATLATYFGLLVFAAAVALLIGPPLIADMHLSPGAAAGLRSSAGAAAGETTTRLTQLPGLGEWIRSIVPANAMKSAADGALLPLVVFTLLFALAARRIDARLRRSLVDVFGAIASATRTIVDWVIAAAPAGVFALVLVMASRMGPSLASSMVYYVMAYSAATILFALLVYPVASVVGRFPLPTFTRAVFPAQTVAVSSSSSLASLPALVEGARALGLSPSVAGFVLPLSVSVFKAVTPIAWLVGTLFLAKLYGVTLGTAAVVTIALTSVLLSLTIPGVPQGAMLVLATVVSSFGVPAAGMALLIGADAIPDLFATMANVTSDLAAATIVGRRAIEDDVAESADDAASSEDA